MADFTRHDNLIRLLRSSRTPVADVSHGVVPDAIPDAKAGGLDGWDIKSRGLTRTLAFWLNQGAAFVLLHSAYEGKTDEMSHALMPYMEDPLKFRWSDSRPLSALRALVSAWDGAEKLAELDELTFQFSLAEDAELIGPSAEGGRLTASDAVALLPFQVTARRFAVAAYVVTPNIAAPMAPVRMALRIGRTVAGDVATLHPSGGASGKAEIVRREDGATTIAFDVRDDVTWLVFDVK